MKPKSFIRTDLACECIDTGKRLPDGIRQSKEQVGRVKITRVEISSEEEAKRLGKACGEYLTFSFGRLSDLEEAEVREVSRVLSEELKKMAERICGKIADGNFSVLAAGLGNAKMTPDAIGPEAISKTTVTGHIFRLAPEVFSSLGSCRLYSVSPGVLGDTGIESLEIIRGAVQSVKPDLVVVIDALAARSFERLAGSVQMADVGINPGSGVGNKRKEISQKTLGVPVIALGVPTVVDCATLVCDFLDRAGLDSESAEFDALRRDTESFFVAPRDSDEVTRRASDLIGDALDMAFGINRDHAKYN